MLIEGFKLFGNFSLIPFKPLHLLFKSLSQVCLLLEPTDVFRTIALLLSATINFDSLFPPNSITPQLSLAGNKDLQPELEFIAKMVQMLNQILMTTRF